MVIDQTGRRQRSVTLPVNAPASAHKPAQKPALAAIPYILVLFCGVFWGMTFSLARLAASGQAHPIGLAFWQAFGGGLVLLFFCLLRWRWPKLDRANLKHSCVIALFGTAIPATLYFYAAPKLPVGVLAITIALVPILTYTLSWMLGIDRPGRWRTVGILMGFIAIALLVAPDSSLPDRSMTIWLILPLVASVFYTLENVYVDMYIPQNSDMTGLLTSGLMIAAGMLGLVVYVEGSFFPINLPLDNAELAILAMAPVSAAAYLMFLYLVKMAGAVFASMAGYVMTVAGVFWGIFFFSERHSLWVWAALVVMLVGMMLITPRRNAPDIGAHG